MDLNFQQFIDHRGFSGRLYETVKASVLEQSTIIPGSEVEVRLPLQIWCLMSGVNSRAGIPIEIANLRDEFSGTRTEPSKLDIRISNASREADRVNISRHYTEAFAAVLERRTSQTSSLYGMSFR